jgi:endoglucanase
MRWCFSYAILGILSLIGALALAVSGGGVSAEPAVAQRNMIFARGINLSSGSFNDAHSPGIYGTDYIYPSLEDFDYYAKKGFAVVRLTYLWDRLQHSLFGELDRAELSRIKDVVAAARVRNMQVILSPHNFGRYPVNGIRTLIGTTGVPNEAFADFTYKVATAFAGNDAVYALSLMNEPHDSEGLWKQTAQAGLYAIRRADPERLILAPGDHWSSAHGWQQYNADFLLEDPADRITYEAHQYFDADHTGSYKVGYTLNGASPDRGIEWVRPFVEWLKQHRQKGIITEFGVPNDDARWLELLQSLLSYLAQEKIPWTYWTGGPWWGTYKLSVEPKNGVDAPVMTVLTKDYGMLRSEP